MYTEVQILKAIIAILVLVLINVISSAHHYKVLAGLWKSYYETYGRIIDKISKERDRYYDELVELRDVRTN